MITQVFVNIFASGCGCHVLFESLIDGLKLSCFFSQLAFDVTRTEDVLQVDPVLLNDEPVVDYQHGIVYHFLDVFCLASLPLEVSVAQNGTEIGQQFIEFCIEVIDFIQNKGIFVPWVIRFVLLRRKLKSHPSALVLLNLNLQNLFLLCQSSNLDDLVLINVELPLDNVLKFEIFINDELTSHYLLNFSPILKVLLDRSVAESDHHRHGCCELGD